MEVALGAERIDYTNLNIISKKENKYYGSVSQRKTHPLITGQWDVGIPQNHQCLCSLIAEHQTSNLKEAGQNRS